jgi:AraC family transcriptional regulator of adaptative response / DNA-3-methyladenine glycosylase II
VARSTAEQLLAFGREPLADVARAAGFESDAAFERAFYHRAAMAPQEYRALAHASEFQLRLPADFRTAELLAYLARDPEGLAERVAGTTIIKGLATASEPILVSIELQTARHRAHCRLETTQALRIEDRLNAHALALRLLGLHSDADGFQARAQADPAVARLIESRPGLRLSLTATEFEALVWAVLGQQVNLSFATRLRRMVIELAGRPIPGSTLRLHPTAAQLADLAHSDLTKRQCSRAKAHYLLQAAQAVATGRLPLERLAEAAGEDAERRLLELHGVGPWTARYVMLRGLGFGDCAPIGDSGLAAGLQRFFALPERPVATVQERLMAPFAPHRTLATAHLWASFAHDP